jgi:predicted metal-binding membrane protein
MSTSARFSRGAGGVILGLAAAAWYGVAAAPGNAGSMRMDLSAPVYMATWVLMLVAMMFPAVTPRVSAFARVVRTRDGSIIAVVMFVLGYLVVWTAAGLIPLALFVASRGVIGGMSGTTAGPVAIGAVLIGAGLYQFTHWKNACLRACRSPMGFVLGHNFDSGIQGAFVAGARHSVVCLGCCWALMSVLLVVGLMSLPVMAGLSVVFLAEKNWSRGARLSRATGVAVAGIGLVVIGLALL